MSSINFPTFTVRLNNLDQKSLIKKGKNIFCIIVIEPYMLTEFTAVKESIPTSMFHF